MTTARPTPLTPNQIRGPDVSLVASTGIFTAAAGAFLDLPSLPTTGTYSIVLDPEGAAAGTLSLTVEIGGPGAGTITADGSAVTVVLASQQDVNLTFSGTAGQKVSVLGTSNFNGCWWIRIKKPDGTFLTSTLFCSKLGFREPVVLPTTGTYTLIIAPYGTTSGTANIALFMFVDIVGAITQDGAAVAATITTPGQVARLAFTAVAGQKFSATAASDFPNSSTGCYKLAILKPDLTLLGGTVLCGNTGFTGPLTIPTAGTYWLTVDPDTATIGPFWSLKLYTVIDPTGSMTLDGQTVSPVLIPGAVARFTFPGTQGQKITALTRFSTTGYYTPRILKPDGTALITGALGGNAVPQGTLLEPSLLPVTGTYTFEVDPYDSVTGTATMSVYAVPADASASIAINGPAVPLTIGVPGQGGVLTFSAAAPGSVTFRVAASTMSGTTQMQVKKPDGTVLFTGSFSSTYNSGAKTLPVAGTYTIVLNPDGPAIGTMTWTLTAP